MHGLGLDPNDLGAQIGLSVAIGALLAWALTWATLVRGKTKALNLLKSQISRIDSPAEAELPKADVPSSLLLACTADPLEKGINALGARGFEEAIGQLTEAIRGVADAFFYRGVAQYELHRYEQALGDFDIFLTLNPTNAMNARALVNKGVALAALNRNEEAIALYDEVISRFSTATQPALQEQVARALVNKGSRLVPAQTE
jgi:tetratricopeptide (TPR) repeat protein